MGVYTEKFRELTDKLPKSPKDFPGPEFAAMAMAQVINASLQIMASLEETLEDTQREKETLEEKLMETMGDVWTPRKED